MGRVAAPVAEAEAGLSLAAEVGIAVAAAVVIGAVGTYGHFQEQKQAREIARNSLATTGALPADPAAGAQPLIEAPPAVPARPQKAPGQEGLGPVQLPGIADGSSGEQIRAPGLSVPRADLPGARSTNETIQAGPAPKGSPAPLANQGVTNSPHGSAVHDSIIDAVVNWASATAQGARDVRKNQQQVDATGTIVGPNRPDASAMDKYQTRYNFEVDTTLAGHRKHLQQVPANDPSAVNVFILIDRKGGIRRVEIR